MALILFAVAGISLAQTTTPTTASVPPSAQPASVWIEAVRTLAARIVSLVPSSDPVHFDFNNLSSVDAAEAGAVRRELTAELGRRGLHLSPDAGATTHVGVARSESTDGYLLVARIHRTDGDQVAMAAGPQRTTGVDGAGGRVEHPLVLLRKPVWERRRPILDFAALPAEVSGGAEKLLVLQPDAITLYARPGEQWVVEESAPLHHVVPWPRDARGWIDLNNHKIELPNMECTEDPLKPTALACAPANGNGRFPREMQQLPLASSLANANDAGDSLLLDLACDDARVALVTGIGDWTEPDTIQAYELKEEALVASGDPLPFPGPVVALWPSSDLKSARVVARNLRTGLYEASVVSVTCGN